MSTCSAVADKQNLKQWSCHIPGSQRFRLQEKITDQTSVAVPIADQTSMAIPAKNGLWIAQNQKPQTKKQPTSKQTPQTERN